MESLNAMYLTNEAYAESIVRQVAEMRSFGFEHKQIDATLVLPKASVKVWNGRRAKFLREKLNLS